MLGPYDARRVYRGSGWYDVARFCRSDYRCGFGPGNRYSYLGFRPARGG
ncbi:MAG TPA: hypothetical protein VMW52_01415 [Phycisphaerae bacterium]|nr:hypothetical protein [Phycisphaerae bacterium]